MGADMGSWAKMMQGAQDVTPIKESLDPAVYAACFKTEAGKAVLADLYARFVNVTIVEPGQPLEVHGIRQGQANVVFDLIDKIAKAEGPET